MSQQPQASRDWPWPALGVRVRRAAPVVLTQQQTQEHKQIFVYNKHPGPKQVGTCLRVILWDGLQAPIHPLEHQQDVIMCEVLDVHLLRGCLQAVCRHEAEFYFLWAGNCSIESVPCLECGGFPAGSLPAEQRRCGRRVCGPVLQQQDAACP